MEELKPDVAQSKYHPLSLQEFQELDATVSSLGTHLPENKAGYVWNNFNKLRNEREPQPCMCGSAGAHWKRAVDYLTDWTNQRK
jgi:UDP-N-acetylenolpyruvoylglucosamine reductase